MRLDLPNFVDTGETVTVSYQDPSAGDDTASLQAEVGDDARSFTDYPVTVASGGGPVLRSAVTNSIVDGVLLLFDREIDTRSSKLPPTSAFSVVDDDGTQTITRLLAGELLTFLPDAGVAIRPVYQRSAIFLNTSTLTAGVTVTYTDPNFENDATAIQTLGGVDAASFTVSAVSGSEALAAEAAPLTATFRDVPARHGGEAFTLELAFSEPVQVSAEQLASALAVSNGAVTQAAQVDAESTRDWLVTVTPAGSDAVTVALVPKASCDAPGAICTADGRGLADEAEAEVPGRAPTRVVSATVTSGPGENGVWDEGETVEAQVRFSREVGVYGPPGAGPVLDVLLDGTAYEAAYTGGSGTDTFTFSYTVTAAAAGARSAGVASNGLSANGVILGDDEGMEAELGFEAEPDPAAPPTRLTLVRRLAENAAPGVAVGPPVVAGDPDVRHAHLPARRRGRGGVHHRSGDGPAPDEGRGVLRLRDQDLVHGGGDRRRRQRQHRLDRSGDPAERRGGGADGEFRGGAGDARTRAVRPAAAVQRARRGRAGGDARQRRGGDERAGDAGAPARRGARPGGADGSVPQRPVGTHGRAFAHGRRRDGRSAREGLRRRRRGVHEGRPALVGRRSGDGVPGDVAGADRAVLRGAGNA